MVTSVIPYIYFSGNCEEALNFYAKALKGEIQNIMRVSDGPKEYQQPGLENRVMHAVLTIGKATIYTSDDMGQNCSPGENISINLNFDATEALEDAWKNMAEGGKVTMELQDTFWGARFGSLSDKFGINWMFNCEKKG